MSFKEKYEKKENNKGKNNKKNVVDMGCPVSGKMP
jgi:hypothetical protein